MKAQQLAGILERIEIHVHNNTTDLAPKPSSKPSSFYCDEQLFRREVALLKRTPHIALLSTQLSQPGQFIARDDLQTPLVLVRNGKGEIRAFANRCRHRGAKVINTSHGIAKAFSCPYHAWTYDLNGALLGIPHTQAFAHLSHHQLGLKEYPTYEAFGLIWLSLREDECTSFKQETMAHLEPLLDDLSALDLTNTQLIEVNEYPCAANWKILVEGFLEGYHVQTTHKQTFAPGVINNLYIHDYLGCHSRSFYPLKKLKRYFENMNSMEPRQGLSCVYHIFPHTFLAVEPYQYTILQFIPLSIDQTCARVTVCMPITYDEFFEKSEKERELLLAGVREDIHIAESIQSNLKSGYDAIYHYGLYEGAITHFHEELGKSLATMHPADRYR